MSINNFIVEKDRILWGVTDDFKPIYVKYSTSMENKIDILWPSSAAGRYDNIMTWYGNSRKLHFNWLYQQGDKPSNLNPVINRTFSQLGFPGYVNVRASSIVYWPTTDKKDCIELGYWRGSMPNVISLDAMNKLAGVDKPKPVIRDTSVRGTGQSFNYIPTEAEEAKYDKQREDLDAIRYLYDKFCAAIHRGDNELASSLSDEAMEKGLQSIFDNSKSIRNLNDEMTWKLLQFYKEVKPEGWNPILERAMAKENA